MAQHPPRHTANTSRSVGTITETSPLLVVSSANDSFLDNTNDDVTAENQPASHNHHRRGQATARQTVLNLSKTCMGTGTLALAFACQQGGLVLFIAGLLLIAAWNVYSVYRLIQCRQLLLMLPLAVVVPPSEPLDNDNNKPNSILEEEVEAPLQEQAQIPSFPFPQHQQHPPRGTSTLGRVAFYAFGPAGLQTLDVMLVILLLGIVISYIAAVVSFVGDTPLTTGRVGADALLTGTAMALLSLVPDMGHLSGASAVGLVVLLAAFVVIAGYGVVLSWEEPAEQGPNYYDDGGDGNSLQLWPQSLSGISHWFGIVVFGYGIVPLTYNLQESMKQPDRIVGASAISLLGVAVTYIVMGVGLYVLFPHLESDVLHELPSTGWLPIVTRLAMTGTVLVTAPLLIVPCSELLEGKFFVDHSGPLPRAAVRFGVVGVGIVVAVLLPSFVEVLSFVGCFCVATVSFILPPLLHLRLVYLAHVSDKGDAVTTTTTRRRLNKTEVVVDAVLLVWGIVATVISSICTLRN